MYRQQGECEEPCIALALTLGSAVTLDMLCCVVLCCEKDGCPGKSCKS